MPGQLNTGSGRSFGSQNQNLSERGEAASGHAGTGQGDMGAHARGPEAQLTRGMHVICPIDPPSRQTQKGQATT